ncbi:hypothetical protein Nepgr_026749 [Nepenthes gracilis]|uniref:DUF641 domain-containing protein n=1 Tax=Nepenthes gracilis TaxID=150966 RepID=A0AAD3TAB8_NEPGR|nr:hypothetical protein Nepgr_026749 [Nepenthes gracilis]
MSAHFSQFFNRLLFPSCPSLSFPLRCLVPNLELWFLSVLPSPVLSPSLHCESCFVAIGSHDLSEVLFLTWQFSTIFLKMDSVPRSAITPSKSRLARTFAKVLHVRAATGIAPDDGFQKLKSHENTREFKTEEKLKVDHQTNGHRSKSSVENPKEQHRDELVVDALLAKIFASISSIKAAYSQLQLAQSPYDADGIQSSDQIVVSELKNLSELKRLYLTKQPHPHSEKALISAEIQELRSLLKIYEITGKKLESQMKLKESEITFYKEKLEEIKRENRLLEKRLNSSGQLSVPGNLHLSGLNPTHFIPVLWHAIRSIRSFVKLMISEMQSAAWDLDAAVNAIHPGVIYWRREHQCFAIESFVCREMFDSFHSPECSAPEKKKQQSMFFDRFVKMKSFKAKDYLSEKPKSTFGKFCREKYLRLVHAKMESSFFGNLNQRRLIESGEFPETSFFTTFSEMAKRMWLLRCLALSFEPAASIFQAKKGCRFSEVYMESLADEAFMQNNDKSPDTEPTVAFTVVPGFMIGKAVIQCQVYLSRP